MASWQDGAAYAPTERPDGFATPTADPLPVAEPQQSATPGPMAPPRGFDVEPQQPLTTIAATPAPRRDPRESFAVSSTLMTSSPEHPAKRDPKTPFTTSANTDQLPPPTGDPLPPPPGAPTVAPSQGAPQGPGTQGAQRQLAQRPPAQSQLAQRPPSQGPSSSQGGQFNYPPPQVLAQYPGQGQPPARFDPSQTRVLCYVAAGVLLFGLLATQAAPFTLLIAGLLGMRTSRLTGRAGSWAIIAGSGILGFQLLLGSLGSPSFAGAVASLFFLVLFLRGALTKV